MVCARSMLLSGMRTSPIWSCFENLDVNHGQVLLLDYYNPWKLAGMQSVELARKFHFPLARRLSFLLQT